MKSIRVFLSDFFRFLEVKFSKYLNRRAFVMSQADCFTSQTDLGCVHCKKKQIFRGCQIGFEKHSRMILRF